MWISSLNSMSNMILGRHLMSENPTLATLQEKKYPYSIRIASQLKSQNPLDLVQQLKSQNPYQIEQVVQEEETIMCEICVEDVRLSSIFKNGHKCAHRFCNKCISRYIQVKLDDNVSNITCPEPTCSLPLDPLSCRPRLTYQLFSKWCDKLCEAAASLVERVYCPNIECSELVLSECDDNPKRCVCPSCKKPFCFGCQVAWHDGFCCEETQEMRGENDVALRALCMKKKWQRCPKCRHVVERAGGCNNIKCRCGVNFCYRCGCDFCMCHRVSYRLRTLPTWRVLLYILDLLFVFGTHMLREGVYPTHMHGGLM